MSPFSLIFNRIFGGFFGTLYVYFVMLALLIIYDYLIGSSCRSSVEMDQMYSNIQSARILQMFLFFLPMVVLFNPLFFRYRPYDGWIFRGIQLGSDLAASIFCSVFFIVIYHIWLLIILPAESRQTFSLDLLPGCFLGFSGYQSINFFREIGRELQGILSALQGSPIMRKMVPPVIIGIHALLLISQIPWKSEFTYKLYNKVILVCFCGGLYYFLANA